MTESAIAAMLDRLPLDTVAQMHAFVTVTKMATASEGLQVDLTYIMGRTEAGHVVHHSERMAPLVGGSKHAAYVLARRAALGVLYLRRPGTVFLHVTLAGHLASVVEFVRTWRGENAARLFSAWLKNYLEHLGADTQLRATPLFND